MIDHKAISEAIFATQSALALVSDNHDPHKHLIAALACLELAAKPCQCWDCTTHELDPNRIKAEDATVADVVTELESVFVDDPYGHQIQALARIIDKQGREAGYKYAATKMNSADRVFIPDWVWLWLGGSV